MRKERKRKKPKARGGRPSKAKQERILQEQGFLLAERFTLEPLREPVGAWFRPYYDQILKGNARAIVRYVDEHQHQDRLDPSFYELLGRLVVLRFYAVANLILSDVEGRGVIGFPSNMELYEFWYKKLKPRCDDARQYIRASRNDSIPNRDALWRAYVLKPLAPVRYLKHMGEPNEGELQRKENESYEASHRQTMEKLLAWYESHTRETVRSRLQNMGFKGRALEVQTESSFCFECVQRSDLVPKDAFLELALNHMVRGRRSPVFTPAQAARRFACRIARISESTASHKNMGKL